MIQARIELHLRKAPPGGSFTDSFKAPYSVGQVSKEGYWEIVELESPLGTGVESLPTLFGELLGGNPALAEGELPTNWEVVLNTTPGELKVEYIEHGAPPFHLEMGGFGSDILSTFDVDTQEPGTIEYIFGELDGVSEGFEFFEAFLRCGDGAEATLDLASEAPLQGGSSFPDGSMLGWELDAFRSNNVPGFFSGVHESGLGKSKVDLDREGIDVYSLGSQFPFMHPKTPEEDGAVIVVPTPLFVVTSDITEEEGSPFNPFLFTTVILTFKRPEVPKAVTSLAMLV